MLNHAVIAGRLTRDPEIRDVGETQVCNFTIATSEKFKDKNGEQVEKPCFMDLVAWGRNAENIHKFMKKGQEHHFVCKIKMDKWLDETTQKNRTAIKFEVIQWSFGNNPREDSGSGDDYVPNRTREAETKKKTVPNPFF